MSAWPAEKFLREGRAAVTIPGIPGWFRWNPNFCLDEFELGDRVANIWHPSFVVLDAA